MQLSPLARMWPQSSSLIFQIYYRSQPKMSEFPQKLSGILDPRILPFRSSARDKLRSSKLREMVPMSPCIWYLPTANKLNSWAWILNWWNTLDKRNILYLGFSLYRVIHRCMTYNDSTLISILKRHSQLGPSLIFCLLINEIH